MSYVFDQATVKGPARMVLLSLAWHANAQYESWPAVQTIAHKARLHRRNVQHALRLLENYGEIVVVGHYSRGGRRTTTYLLVRCRDFLVGVGTPTDENPYGNSGTAVGLANDFASDRSEHPQQARGSAAPAALLRHPSSIPAPPLQHSSATGAASLRHPENTRYATPAASERRPSSMPAPPDRYLNRHGTVNYKNPPNPPQAGGTLSEAIEPVELQAPGALLRIHKPKRNRLWTEREQTSLHGAFYTDYVTYFERKGWKVEVVNG